MNWKFWQKKQVTDETEIRVSNASATYSGGLGINTEVYVRAQSTEKALELYDKLKRREKSR